MKRVRNTTPKHPVGNIGKRAAKKKTSAKNSLARNQTRFLKHTSDERSGKQERSCRKKKEKECRNIHAETDAGIADSRFSKKRVCYLAEDKKNKACERDLPSPVSKNHTTTY